MEGIERGRGGNGKRLIARQCHLVAINNIGGYLTRRRDTCLSERMGVEGVDILVCIGE